MGKVRRKGVKSGKAAVVYGSDDERAYSREAAPDPEADDFFHDEVDQFHSARDKISLERSRDLQPAALSSDEDEVLGFDDDEDDDDDDEDDEEIQALEKQMQKFKSQGFKDEMGSDLEDDNDDGLPDEKAWGSSRAKFYGGDIDSDEDVDFSGSEPDDALLEEQEALALQKKMAEQLEDQDFDLDIFKVTKKPDVSRDTETDQKIEKDLSKLTKREKLQLLKKESPELLELVDDYKVKMKELRERLLPLHKLAQDGTLPASKGTQYINTKVSLYMNYCVNITYYLMLKARQTPVHSHPVISRLAQYRNLIKQLEPGDKKIQPKLDNLLEKVKNGEDLGITPATAPVKQKKTDRKQKQKVKVEKQKEKRKLSEILDDGEGEEEEAEDDRMPEGGRSWGRKKSQKTGQYETLAEKEALANYELMKGSKRKKLETPEEDEGYQDDDQDGMEEYNEEYMEEYGDEDGKRGVTNEILKNKGLTPHRKKEYKNPRVKHRIKARKAKIRRKGMIREVRTEMDRYGGEISGIRAGVKRGIKLK